MELKYKRISLKLSGEALSANNDVIAFENVDNVAQQISQLHSAGVEVGITLGGGNIWRGRSSGEMDKNRADHMGMLSTVINSLALCDALLKLNVPCIVMSSVDMPRICESFSARAANDALANGKVVIFAGGSGLPFFTTDTAAALKAAEIGANALLLAKNVDAVYSEDPNVYKDVVRYTHLTYDDVINRSLKATDLTAMTMCKSNNIPIVLFAMKERGNILRAVCGEEIGTVIDAEIKK